MSETVMYLGRVVPKAGFRAFVYGLENKSMLVNSYEEFEKAITSGIWWPSKDHILEKTRPKKKGGE